MNETSKIPRVWLALGVATVIVGLGGIFFAVAPPVSAVRPLADVPGAEVEVIPHADARLDLAGVAALPPAAWQRWTARGYLSAAHGEVIWVRVRFANAEATPVRGVLADLSYFSDRVDAWLDDGAGGWRTAVSGGAVAGGAKPLWARTAAFPIDVPARGARLIYLRVSDAYLAHLQPTWWADEKVFFGASVRLILVECVCYGALLALVLYNLVLWLRLRFPDTGWYLLSAGASVAGNILTNGGPALLGVPLGSPWHETLMAAGFGLGGLCMLQFTRVFLGSAELLPRVDRALRWWRWTLTAIVLGVPLMLRMESPAWLPVVALAALLTDAFCVAAAFVAWRRGVRHARFFLLAYVPLLLAVLPALLTLVWGEVMPGTASGLLAGRTLEMLLLSFAIAERFAATQRRLVEETEQRRLVEEAYADELQLEVRERTAELEQANADKDRMLAVIGHDLRSPLTALMKSADRPGADFARETARTGRALLLMIEDLVLWARLRAGSRDFAAHSAGALLQPAVALHRALAAQGGTALAIDVPAELRIETDLVLAQTLVRNLLANALKFAHSRIELGAAAVADGVRFTIGNDGPALPVAVVARLAADENEPMTATGGLGLRLCREICVALGTKLEAHAPAAGGAEFGFTLPAAAAREEAS